MGLERRDGHPLSYNPDNAYCPICGNNKFFENGGSIRSSNEKPYLFFHCFICGWMNESDKLLNKRQLRKYKLLKIKNHES